MVCECYLGQCNNFDVLCKCYGVDNFGCDLYGVLFDVEIFVDVYLVMIGGQISLLLVGSGVEGDGSGWLMVSLICWFDLVWVVILVLCVNVEELVVYVVWLVVIEKLVGGLLFWV